MLRMIHNHHEGSGSAWVGGCSCLILVDRRYVKQQSLWLIIGFQEITHEGEPRRLVSHYRSS